MSKVKAKSLFGRIYLATNTSNSKVYVGKVERPRTIKMRWNTHLSEGRTLRRQRELNPEKKIYGTHLNNAIAKYDESVWKVEQIDIGFNLEELNDKERFWIKKLDSMNPKKGYNMTEGGDGGRLSAEIIELLREKTLKNWQDKKFIEKQSKGVLRKWQEPDYIEKQKRAMKRKQNSAEYKRILRIFHLKFSKTIKNKEQFLKDIKEGMSLADLQAKYKMSHPTLLKNIKQILKKYGVKDYRQAKRFLNKKEFLLDIKQGMLAKDIRIKHKTNTRVFRG